MKRVHPYLNFPGNTEEAFTFYRTVFGGEFAALFRFRDFDGNPMGIAEEDLDRIAHIALPIGPDTMLMATDVVGGFGKELTVGSHVYLSLEPDTAEEAERVFDALAQGGAVEMALQETEWAEKYGTCTDRFGVQWMVSYAGARVFGDAPAESSAAESPAAPAS